LSLELALDLVQGGTPERELGFGSAQLLVQRPFLAVQCLQRNAALAVRRLEAGDRFARAADLSDSWPAVRPLICSTLISRRRVATAIWP
jgi:hypothetical protein